MGLRVQNFWTYMSFGLLGYDMSRTHSIMRIATTASPVSGAAVRGRMQAKALANEWDEAHKKVLNSVYMRRARMNENWYERGDGSNAFACLTELSSEPDEPGSCP